MVGVLIEVPVMLLVVRVVSAGSKARTCSKSAPGRLGIDPALKCMPDNPPGPWPYLEKGRKIGRPSLTVCQLRFLRSFRLG